MPKWLIVLLACGAIWYFWRQPGSVELAPGVMAPNPPLQTMLREYISHRVADIEVAEVAKFKIKAKVLGRKDYLFGRESDLSPTDLALGWGNMSDQRVVDQIEISQSGRFYFWRVSSFPIPRREIQTHSANMHLIPADELVARTIKQVRIGDIVEISGSLVNATTTSGWYWNSSTTREDTGAGACELIWVEDMVIVTPEA